MTELAFIFNPKTINCGILKQKICSYTRNTCPLVNSKLYNLFIPLLESGGLLFDLRIHLFHKVISDPTKYSLEQINDNILLNMLSHNIFHEGMAGSILPPISK